jgi:ATP-dependent DNA helicase HFM1/MER3
MLRCIASKQRMFMVYLAPTKALCNERYQDWKNRFSKFVKISMATGDSEEGLELDSVGLLLCTPEKFDALTRVRESAIALMTMLRLLMIDEIHSVGDSRGAAIEIIVSRTKFLNPTARLVAVSASVGNPHDFCQWLSNAQLMRVDDSNRSVPLHRHVLGFPSTGMNPFQFENSLNSQLAWIIRKHSSNLPTLIFCSTRRSAESTADYLSKSADYLATLNGTSNSLTEAFFTTSKLNTLTSRGVAFHNAGIPFEDRRAVEYMFINGKIKVLCATSTLAVGVNLPAHLVIIKGTKQYTNRGYEEYDVMDIQQMIGRAGRPQFDKFGVAVILTTQEKKDYYQDTSASAIIESKYFDEKDGIIMV